MAFYIVKLHIYKANLNHYTIHVEALKQQIRNSIKIITDRVIKKLFEMTSMSGTLV